MIHVALLSRWHVHADDYAREASENKGVSIQLVWDEDVERGAQWAKELGVPFEADLQKVLSDPTIDGVIVTTPTSMHKEIFIKAAHHKKHIFTEKVLAFTVKECEEIYAAVEANGIELMVSLPRLTDKAYLLAEKSLNQGWLGELTMIRCRLAHNGAVPSEANAKGWLPARFFDKKQAGGGALMDLGAHPIYLINRLAGQPEAIYARLQKQKSEEVEDSAAVTVEYASGLLGMIETGFLSHGSPFQLELYGTEGSLLIKDDQIKLESLHVNKDKWLTMNENPPVVPKPMEQWIAIIHSGTKPTITKEDIISLTLVNEAAILSHLEGRRISVNEITAKVK